MKPLTRVDMISVSKTPFECYKSSQLKPNLKTLRSFFFNKDHCFSDQRFPLKGFLKEKRQFRKDLVNNSALCFCTQQQHA